MFHSKVLDMLDDARDRSSLLDAMTRVAAAIDLPVFKRPRLDRPGRSPVDRQLFTRVARPPVSRGAIRQDRPDRRHGPGRAVAVPLVPGGLCGKV